MIVAGTTPSPTSGGGEVSFPTMNVVVSTELFGVQHKIDVWLAHNTALPALRREVERTLQTEAVLRRPKGAQVLTPLQIREMQVYDVETYAWRELHDMSQVRHQTQLYVELADRERADAPRSLQVMGSGTRHAREDDAGATPAHGVTPTMRTGSALKAKPKGMPSPALPQPTPSAQRPRSPARHVAPLDDRRALRVNSPLRRPPPASSAQEMRHTPPQSRARSPNAPPSGRDHRGGGALHLPQSRPGSESPARRSSSSTPSKGALRFIPPANANGFNFDDAVQRRSKQTTAVASNEAADTARSLRGRVTSPTSPRPSSPASLSSRVLASSLRNDSPAKHMQRTRAAPAPQRHVSRSPRSRGAAITDSTPASARSRGQTSVTGHSFYAAKAISASQDYAALFPYGAEAVLDGELMTRDDPLYGMPCKVLNRHPGNKVEVELGGASGSIVLLEAGKVRVQGRQGLCHLHDVPHDCDLSPMRVRRAVQVQAAQPQSRHVSPVRVSGADAVAQGSPPREGGAVASAEEPDFLKACLGSQAKVFNHTYAKQQAVLLDERRRTQRAEQKIKDLRVGVADALSRGKAAAILRRYYYLWLRWADPEHFFARNGGRAPVIAVRGHPSARARVDEQVKAICDAHAAQWTAEKRQFEDQYQARTNEVLEKLERVKAELQRRTEECYHERLVNASLKHELGRAHNSVGARECSTCEHGKQVGDPLADADVGVDAAGVESAGAAARTDVPRPTGDEADDAPANAVGEDAPPSDGALNAGGDADPGPPADTADAQPRGTALWVADVPAQPVSPFPSAVHAARGPALPVAVRDIVHEEPPHAQAPAVPPPHRSVRSLTPPTAVRDVVHAPPLDEDTDTRARGGTVPPASEDERTAISPLHAPEDAPCDEGELSHANTVAGYDDTAALPMPVPKVSLASAWQPETPAANPSSVGGVLTGHVVEGEDVAGLLPEQEVAPYVETTSPVLDEEVVERASRTSEVSDADQAPALSQPPPAPYQEPRGATLGDDMISQLQRQVAQLKEENSVLRSQSATDDLTPKGPGPTMASILGKAPSQPQPQPQQPQSQPANLASLAASSNKSSASAMAKTQARGKQDAPANEDDVVLIELKVPPVSAPPQTGQPDRTSRASPRASPRKKKKR